MTMLRLKQANQGGTYVSEGMVALMVRDNNWMLSWPLRSPNWGIPVNKPLIGICLKS
jgi:hypothetical protein